MSQYREGFADGFRAAMDLLRGFPTMSPDTVTEAVIMNTAAYAEAERGQITDGFRRGNRPGKQTKPRKPSAYQKWAKTERKKIAKEHPRYSFGRINKELGIRWKREKRRRGMK